MGGARVPGPLDGTKTAAIDDGTLNRQASSAPGPIGVPRNHSSSELTRTLIEFNPDLPKQLGGAERLRWKRMGYTQESRLYTEADARNWFEGFSLSRRSTILLLPNRYFQPTPWERAF